MASITQCDGAVARQRHDKMFSGERVLGSKARRKGGRDEDALTYGLRDQKVKAAVKKRSV
jgi:hypothetical protein